MLGINQLDYSEATKKIQTLMGFELTDDEIIELLSLKDKILISEFLEEFDKFSKTQLVIIEKYINDNHKSNDIMFLSDLIDFADLWGLSLDFDNFLSYLNNSSEDYHPVVLSLVWYIHNNFKYYYFREIKELLEGILNNPTYLQNIQISAALCLFRHTHKPEYIDDIKGWMDNEFNIGFVENTFNHLYYQEEFFDRKTKLKMLNILKDH